jgi:hypothetical protein
MRKVVDIAYTLAAAYCLTRTLRESLEPYSSSANITCFGAAMPSVAAQHFPSFMHVRSAPVGVRLTRDKVDKRLHSHGRYGLIVLCQTDLTINNCVLNMAAPTDTNNDTSLIIPLWIDGREESSSSTFEITNPVSSHLCWSAASATSDDARRAIEAADRAFVSWSKSKPAQRMEILLRTATVLEQNSAEYATYMATEMGVETSVAQFFMLPLAVSMLRDIAGRTVSICGSVPQCQQQGQSAMVFKEPYGVCLGIVPWSVPV